MSAPLFIAVVGPHQRGQDLAAGTLTRRRDFGKGLADAGTTRHVESVALTIDGSADALCRYARPRGIRFAARS